MKIFSLVCLIKYCSFYSQSVSNSWQTVADHVRTTEFTVKDLRPNTVYLFIIRAVNAQGLGDPSPMSEPVRTQGMEMACNEFLVISITFLPSCLQFISLSQTLVPQHREWITVVCRRSWGMWLSACITLWSLAPHQCM